MRLRTLLLGVMIAVLPASAAMADEFMDLPGMGAAEGALPEGAADSGGDVATADEPDASGGGDVSAAQVTEPELPDNPLDLPGSGALPVGGSESGVADTDQPRTASADEEGDALPRSGKSVAAIALVGVALVSSGRLLREFAPGN